ncbi:appetite-regulating hormone [Megaptera novaeangliae]
MAPGPGQSPSACLLGSEAQGGKQGEKRGWNGGRMLPRDALSSRPICPQPAEAMPSPGTVCSLLLLSVLWVDLAMAGSSFLSPEHQKVQQRKESKKLSAKPKPRALEGWLDAEVRSQAEGAGDELEIQFSAPFDVGIKLSGAHSHQHGQTLGKFLQDVLWEDASETPADK